MPYQSRAAKLTLGTVMESRFNRCCVLRPGSQPVSPASHTVKPLAAMQRTGDGHKVSIPPNHSTSAANCHPSPSLRYTGTNQQGPGAASKRPPPAKVQGRLRIDKKWLNTSSIETLSTAKKKILKKTPFWIQAQLRVSAEPSVNSGAWEEPGKDLAGS